MYPEFQDLPKYRSHKIVAALKIGQVSCSYQDIDNEGHRAMTDVLITPDNEKFAPFNVTPDWWHKHLPAAGGYFVVYKDGYSSYSPAPAFEEGNAECPDLDPDWREKALRKALLSVAAIEDTVESLEVMLDTTKAMACMVPPDISEPIINAVKILIETRRG